MNPRRLIVRMASLIGGIPAVIRLATHHRPVGTLVLGGGLVCYWVGEWVAWLLRDVGRAKADRTAEHATAGVLLDVTYTREYDGRAW